VEAMARWYWSKTSPSRVSGHSSRCTMNTSTLKVPAASCPSNACMPPTSRMAVKATRIAMRISGTNALENTIAAWFACR